MGKAMVALLLLGAAACDSSPRYQFAVGVCALFCDGTMIEDARQDPICLDTEEQSIEDLTRHAEQIGTQVARDKYPACGVVGCSCDLHLSGEDCRP